MDKFLPAVIDRFNDRQAVIKLADGQELLWPINNLPAGLTEGSAIKLYLSDLAEAEIKKQSLAKNILREILQPNA